MDKGAVWGEAWGAGKAEGKAGGEAAEEVEVAAAGAEVAEEVWTMDPRMQQIQDCIRREKQEG